MNTLKVGYSDLLNDYKRIIKKYYDKLDDHEKYEDYLEEYNERLENIFSPSVFKDDFISLATDFAYFLKKYYIKESEINYKFLYVFKNNEAIEEFLCNFYSSIHNDNDSVHNYNESIHYESKDNDIFIMIMIQFIMIQSIMIITKFIMMVMKH